MTKKYVQKTTLELSSFRENVVNSWLTDNMRTDGKFRLILEVEEDDGVGNWYWHAHHAILAEPLLEPLQKRIDYVKKQKMDDVPTRLKWMTPVVGPLPDGLDALWKKKFGGENPADSSKQIISLDLIKLHAKEHPRCPWNGETILSKMEDEDE
jgi:hypothetical protein